MAEEVYDKLADALMMRGGATPPQKCREFFQLIEELFTPQEAELACKMPMGLFTAAQMSDEAVMEPAEAERLLEEMTDKGLLFTRVKGGIRQYKLMPLAPGIYEYQFMRGTYTDRDKKLARLFKDLHKINWGTPEANKNRPSFPFSRVLVIEKTVPTGMAVHPYDKVSEHIEGAEYISVSQCFCRHQAELLEEPCDKPKEVCFSFGPSAQFAAERGFGRLVDKKEALKILTACEEAGLVHCSSNVADKIDFLCNCCICHCGILQTFKDAKLINFGATSNYIVQTDNENCDGCETCIEICPMDALVLEDGVIKEDPQLCIGCGLCASACPSDALTMALREPQATTPQNSRELIAAMIASMPKPE